MENEFGRTLSLLGSGSSATLVIAAATEGVMARQSAESNTQSMVFDEAMLDLTNDVPVARLTTNGKLGSRRQRHIAMQRPVLEQLLLLTCRYNRPASHKILEYVLDAQSNPNRLRAVDGFFAKMGDEVVEPAPMVFVSRRAL